ncbi:NAD(P)H-binding protein [Actinoplanes sp. TBRC 11911]|uniref:NAD(P)-dependent oxidoreductase n=1 Tax=Actinoplanes sp. TBRC 11911 TaxID=2729386 RepID=UPI00145F17B1|nr:NAD(P)H-binding protein [Actinoplanes sp. TBRC 11911]NMO54780.1 NAD(P)H-binding protein [Actinoplanes sp. TBRC 11911]
MSNVVVFGYSGFGGGHITEELLARGHRVTGVARTATTDARPNLTTHAGSVHDAAFVERITQDADVIVVALPGAPDGQPELASALPALLEAAARAGARLGVVGGGATLLAYEGGPVVRDLPTFPPEYTTEADAHLRALELLRGYDGVADWFYFAPPVGYGPWNAGTRTGNYRLGEEVLIKVPGTAREGFDSSISGPDFAAGFADEIDNPKHHRGQLTIGY